MISALAGDDDEDGGQSHQMLLPQLVQQLLTVTSVLQLVVGGSMSKLLALTCRSTSAEVPAGLDGRDADG